MTLAHNRCHACGHEWTDGVGVRAEHHRCPKCGSLYWKWTNFDETRRKP